MITLTTVKSTVNEIDKLYTRIYAPYAALIQSNSGWAATTAYTSNFTTVVNFISGMRRSLVRLKAAKTQVQYLEGLSVAVNQGVDLLAPGVEEALSRIVTGDSSIRPLGIGISPALPAFNNYKGFAEFYRLLITASQEAAIFTTEVASPRNSSGGGKSKVTPPTVVNNSLQEIEDLVTEATTAINDLEQIVLPAEKQVAVDKVILNLRQLLTDISPIALGQKKNTINPQFIQSKKQAIRLAVATLVGDVGKERLLPLLDGNPDNPLPNDGGPNPGFRLPPVIKEQEQVAGNFTRSSAASDPALQQSTSVSDKGVPTTVIYDHRKNEIISILPRFGAKPNELLTENATTIGDIKGPLQEQLGPPTPVTLNTSQVTQSSTLLNKVESILTSIQEYSKAKEVDVKINTTDNILPVVAPPPTHSSFIGPLDIRKQLPKLTTSNPSVGPIDTRNGPIDTRSGPIDTRPVVTPEQWGIRFTYNDTSNTVGPLVGELAGPSVSGNRQAAYFMDLLPARQSTIGMQGGRDVPNAMPGLNFKYVNAIAKQQIPGFQPVYQHLGVKTMQITIVGCFTGADGGSLKTDPTLADPTTGANPFAVRRLMGESTTSDNLLRGGNAASELNAYNSYLEFLEVVKSGKTLTVEINLFKVYKTIEKSGIPNNLGMQAENGNPKFTGVVRTLDVFHATKERTWYTLVLEVTEFGSSCKSGVPLDLNVKLKEAIVAANGGVDPVATASLKAKTFGDVVNAIEDPVVRLKQLQCLDHMVTVLEYVRDSDFYIFKDYISKRPPEGWTSFFTGIASSFTRVVYDDISFKRKSDTVMVARARIACYQTPLINITARCDYDIFWKLDIANKEKPITRFVAASNGTAFKGLMPEGIMNDGCEGTPAELEELKKGIVGWTNGSFQNLAGSFLGCATATAGVAIAATVASGGLAIPAVVGAIAIGCGLTALAQGIQDTQEINADDGNFIGELISTFFVTALTLGLGRGSSLALKPATAKLKSILPAPVKTNIKSVVNPIQTKVQNVISPIQAKIQPVSSAVKAAGPPTVTKIQTAATSIPGRINAAVPPIKAKIQTVAIPIQAKLQTIATPILGKVKAAIAPIQAKVKAAIPPNVRTTAAPIVRSAQTTAQSIAQNLKNGSSLAPGSKPNKVLPTSIKGSRAKNGVVNPKPANNFTPSVKQSLVDIKAKVASFRLPSNPFSKTPKVTAPTVTTTNTPRTILPAGSIPTVSSQAINPLAGGSTANVGKAPPPVNVYKTTVPTGAINTITSSANLLTTPKAPGSFKPAAPQATSTNGDEEFNVAFLRTSPGREGVPVRRVKGQPLVTTIKGETAATPTPALTPTPVVTQQQQFSPTKDVPVKLREAMQAEREATVPTPTASTNNANPTIIVPDDLKEATKSLNLSPEFTEEMNKFIKETASNFELQGTGPAAEGFAVMLKQKLVKKGIPADQASNYADAVKKAVQANVTVGDSSAALIKDFVPSSNPTASTAIRGLEEDASLALLGAAKSVEAVAGKSNKRLIITSGNTTRTFHGAEVIGGSVNDKDLVVRTTSGLVTFPLDKIDNTLIENINS